MENDSTFAAEALVQPPPAQATASALIDVDAMLIAARDPLAGYRQTMASVPLPEPPALHAL